MSSSFTKVLLLALAANRVFSLFWMIIPDCDEVFNYWEPLNFLLRGFGKQTWEYSPEYAIRSWSYLLPLYFSTFPLNKFIGLTELAPSYTLFYFIRLMLVSFTAYAEYRMFTTLRSKISNKAATWYLIFTSFSTGVSHAGVALLPSSFAMNCNLLAASQAMLHFSANPNSTVNAVAAVTWWIVGGLVGWPFSLALAIPFLTYVTVNKVQFFKYLTCWAIVFMISSGAIIQIDAWFYDKTTFVPLNIVLYNVFGGEGQGPEIFGVEPFIYYVHNLLLNHHVIAILGYLGCLVNLVDTKNVMLSFVVVSGPLILWSLIFGSQAHKEERFLYPIYPLILISASICTEKLFTLANSILNVILPVRILRKLVNITMVIIFATSIVTVSLLRTLNLTLNYGAPLSVYAHLDSASFSPNEQALNVCTGREWYRYPSSFFLSNNMRFKFIKSGFDGLLPGDFEENIGKLESISKTPSNMNNMNLFDPSKVTSFDQCDYYVDIDLPADSEAGEIDIFSVEAGVNWEKLYCDKFIHTEKSSGIGKLIYVPDALRKYINYNVHHVDYCLFKKKTSTHQD